MCVCFSFLFKHSNISLGGEELIFHNEIFPGRSYNSSIVTSGLNRGSRMICL